MSTAMPSSVRAREPMPMSDLVSLVESVASDAAAWAPLVQVPAAGQRWWTRLARTPQADVWLLTWLPGAATELHDHGGSAAAFTVVRGELVELRADRRGRHRSIARRPGEVVWLGPRVIHDVRGGGRDAAVSIHAYSPPLTVMNYYAARAGGVDLVRRVVSAEPEHEPDRDPLPERSG